MQPNIQKETKELRHTLDIDGLQASKKSQLTAEKEDTGVSGYEFVFASS